MKSNQQGREDSMRDLLLNKLQSGWHASHAATSEVIQRIAGNLSAQATILTDYQRPAVEFVLELGGQIRLQGMNEVHCLALCGETGDPEEDVRVFLNKRYAIGRVLFIFCFYADMAERVRASFPKSIRCLVLRVSDVCELLVVPNPKLSLNRLLLAAFPRLSLIAYTIHAPVEANMFFGREEELERILQSPSESFAIAGPPGLGKTSLLRQYEKRLILARDPRAHLRFYMNFLECQPATEDDIASFIAFKVNPSRRSYYTKADDIPDRSSKDIQIDKGPEGFKRIGEKADGLKRFLIRMQKTQGQRLELLLDEVDHVCRSDVFQSLGDCARDGICRLILCGRSELLDMMQQGGSPLNRRLRLIRLRPLDEAEARQLIVEPLADLGIHIQDEGDFVSRVNALTGRFPHLLQFYCRKLAERAVQGQINTVTLDHIEQVRWDHETALFFTSALDGIKDTTLKRVALLLLYRTPPTITSYAVTRLAEENGIRLSEGRSQMVCDELVIENILAWQEGKYLLANDSLAEYAKRGHLFEFLFRQANIVQ